MAVAPSGQPWVRSGQPSVSGLHPWRLETSVVGLRRLARVLLPGPHIGAAYPPLIPLTPGHSGSAGDTRVAQTMVKARFLFPNELGLRGYSFDELQTIEGREVLRFTAGEKEKLVPVDTLDELVEATAKADAPRR